MLLTGHSPDPGRVGPQPPLAILAFMGFEWTFALPLRIGDTIRSRSRTVAKRAMKDGGVVAEEREILNQRGEVVQVEEFLPTMDRAGAGRQIGMRPR